MYLIKALVRTKLLSGLKLNRKYLIIAISYTISLTLGFHFIQQVNRQQFQE